MRKIVLTYGILAGVIVSLLMVLSMLIAKPENEFSYFVGYAGMLIALSMIVVAIRSYRDTYLGGTITFGQAFLVGLYITLITTVFYVVCWKIFSAIAMPDFWDKYAQHTIEAMKKQGKSTAAILEKTKELEGYKNMSPLKEMAMTSIEVLPVGLLISLISAAILRRKPNSRPAIA